MPDAELVNDRASSQPDALGEALAQVMDACVAGQVPDAELVNDLEHSQPNATWDLALGESFGECFCGGSCCQTAGGQLQSMLRGYR